MFFSLSKTLWELVDPNNLFWVLFLLSVLLLWTPWQRAGRRLLTVLAVFGLFVATVPLAGYGLWHLENRFPVMETLTDHVDGVIVAGGILDPKRSKERGQPVLGDAVERLTAMVRLAKAYPQAQVIFSGGAGDPAYPDLKEAHYIAPFVRDMGLDPARIRFEDQARNTAENARITFDLAQPKPGQTWLLVTSAFHMPRAMGTFRKAGWNIQAYPVDFSTPPSFKWEFFFNLSRGLMQLSHISHEIVGLIVYKLTGRSQAFFPGP